MTVDRRAFLSGLAALLVGPAAFAEVRRPSVKLVTPSGRQVALWRWTPAGKAKGQILFSHGAGSAPWKYDALIGIWVAQGWEVVAPLHVDSKDHPDTTAYPGLASWRARIEDLRLVSKEAMKADYVAAGHSYGGLSALALGGAAVTMPEGMTGTPKDPKAACIVALSPPAPNPALVTAEGYGRVSVPMLVQTGTRDIPPGAPDGPELWRGHLAPFDAAPADGRRYALVLKDVDHYFQGAICDPARPGPPQWAEAKQVARLSALFMDAYARNRPHALQDMLKRVSGDDGIQLFRK